MIRRLLLALAALLLPAAQARAWWEYGHEETARIALAIIQPRTRASIDVLLRQQKLLETPTCPAGTLEQASVWTDCVKTLGDRFSYQFNWHYQDPDTCKPFDLTPFCKDGNCVSVQIARGQRMIADRKLPVRDRLIALANLVHFVGDLHQPLHAAEHDGDGGGNGARSSYGAMPRRNLHSIWDGLLADRAISTPVGGGLGILAEVSPDERRRLAEGTITDWSRESWELAKALVYTPVGIDLCAPTPKTPATMDEATIQRLIPALRLQIAKGGLRLARLLDEALDGDHPEVAHPPRPPRTAGGS